MNRLLVGRCTENLFGKIEGIIGTLLKCQEGVIIQILQSDGFSPARGWEELMNTWGLASKSGWNIRWFSFKSFCMTRSLKPLK